MIEIHILWLIFIGIFGAICGIFILRFSSVQTVIENPNPAPTTPPPHPHDDYTEHEKELMKYGQCFGFRTKYGQWIPYPGKPKKT